MPLGIDLVVAVGSIPTEVGTFEKYYVRVRENVMVCQKQWTGGAGGQGATPGHDSEYIECY